jgi:pimeloyl-ACP methyl ester carboxylesterase
VTKFPATGCELYYEDLGSGRPVVFIHGFTVTSRFFVRQRNFFAERHRFVAPDVRSHGRSEMVLTGNTVALQTRDLHELFDALGLRDIVLVGWSNGAFNVWQYFHDYGPDRVAGTVIVDESPCPVTREGWDLGYFDLDGLVHVMAARQTDNETLVRERFLHFIFGQTPHPDDLTWMAEEVLMMPPTIAAAVGLDSMARDYRTWVPEVTVPTLVCTGGLSGIPAGNGEWIAAHTPRARHVVFDNSGHSLFWEDADRFNEELHRFIQQL